LNVAVDWYGIGLLRTISPYQAGAQRASRERVATRAGAVSPPITGIPSPTVLVPVSVRVPPGTTVCMIWLTPSWMKSE
jgi:hypothetical protein